MDQEGNEASKKKGGVNERDQQDNADQYQNGAQEPQVEDDQSWSQCMVEYESDDDSLNSTPSSMQGKTEEATDRLIPAPPIPHMEVSSAHVPLQGRLPRTPAVQTGNQDSANQESSPSLMGFTTRPLPVPGRIEPVPLQEGDMSSGVLVQTDSAPQTDSSAQTGYTLPDPDPMTPSCDMSRDESAQVVSEAESQSAIEVAGHREPSVAETVTESIEDPLAAFSSPFVPPIPVRPTSRPSSRPSSNSRPQSNSSNNVTQVSPPEPPTNQEDIGSSENSSATRDFLLNLQKGIGPDIRSLGAVGGNPPLAVGAGQAPGGAPLTIGAAQPTLGTIGTAGSNLANIAAVATNTTTPPPQSSQPRTAPNDGNRKRRNFFQRLFKRKKDGNSQGAR